MTLVGKTAEVSLRSLPPNAAEALPRPPGQTFPVVVAAAHVVGLMEMAAARLMRGQLRDGEASTTLSTKLQHAQLARPGHSALRAVATCSAVSGRQYHFTVNVFDEHGLVASGEHARALVVERRFVGLALRRAGLPSMQLCP